jgi:hypothetical protein
MNVYQDYFQDNMAMVVLVVVAAIAVIFFTLVFITPALLRFKNRRVNALRRKADARHRR